LHRKTLFLGTILFCQENVLKIILLRTDYKGVYADYDLEMLLMYE